MGRKTDGRHSGDDRLMRNDSIPTEL